MNVRYFIIVILTLAAVVGCASKDDKQRKQREENRKEEVLDFGRVEAISLATADMAIADAEVETQNLLKNESDPTKRARLESISRSHESGRSSIRSGDRALAQSRKDVAQANKDWAAEKAIITKKLEESLAPEYRKMMLLSIAGGVCFSIGVALIAMAWFNPLVSRWSAPIGILAAVLGGTMAMWFFVFRIASPVMVALSWGLGGLVFVVACVAAWIFVRRLVNSAKQREITHEAVKSVVRVAPRVTSARELIEMVPDGPVTSIVAEAAREVELSGSQN